MDKKVNYALFTIGNFYLLDSRVVGPGGIGVEDPDLDLSLKITPPGFESGSNL